MIKHILTISQHRNWELPIPMLLSVRQEDDGELLSVAGSVNADACSDEVLKSIARICRSLTEEEVFAQYGKKSFRKQELGSHSVSLLQ